LRWDIRSGQPARGWCLPFYASFSGEMDATVWPRRVSEVVRESP